MNSFSIFDIIFVLSGAYLTYSAYNMKRTGDLTNSPIIGKGCDVSKAKDPQGFITYMYPKSIAFGVFTMICGALDYVSANYLTVPYLDIVLVVIFLVVFIIYCKCSMDAQKKYLAPKPYDPSHYGKK